MSAEITLPVGQQNQNIIRLATAQALAGANSVVFYATGAIVGNAIAPSPTADATRLADSACTSPATNTPGTLVSR